METPRILLVQKVELTMLADLHKQIREFDERATRPKDSIPWPEKLNVVLATGGGDVADGMGVYDTLRILARKVDLNVVIFGKSMSMGASVMMAVPVEKRFMTSNSSIMVHEIRGGYDGKSAIPNTGREQILEELMNHFEFSKSLNRWTIRTIAKGTGNSVDQIEEWYYASKFFDARAAKKHGFVGGIVRV